MNNGPFIPLAVFVIMLSSVFTSATLALHRRPDWEHATCTSTVPGASIQINGETRPCKVVKQR